MTDKKTIEDGINSMNDIKRYTNELINIGYELIEHRNPTPTIHFLFSFYCPSCMKRVNKIRKNKFCPNCGKGLDWSK